MDQKRTDHVDCWYRWAAEAGHAKAQFVLGLLGYHRGQIEESSGDVGVYLFRIVTPLVQIAVRMD